MVSQSKEKSRRGHLAQLAWGHVSQPPKGPSPEAQLPLLQLSGGCGGNKNNMGTLIRLINSLCSRVVAIRPYSLRNIRSWAGVTQAAGTLPAQPLLATSSVPEKRSQRRDFSGRILWLLFTYSHSQMFTEHLLCAKETVPAMFRYGWKRVGAKEQEMRS